MPLTTFVDGVTSVMASWLNFQDKHTQDVPDSGVAHAASKISNTPAGSISATDVQAAINELDTEKASTASLATYAPLASPTFTGTPAAPTASSTTDTTQIATTAFVQDTWERPAFSAYRNATQSINDITDTKIQINTEDFDTNSCFDNATNYRFTPTVAGYYLVSGQIGWAANATGTRRAIIYKNGAAYKTANVSGFAGNFVYVNVVALVYMNGTTDYLELYGYQSSGGALNTSSSGGGGRDTSFEACFVRKA